MSWHVGFNGVMVNEPTPGPFDMAKVERDIEEIKAILAKARKELGMDETSERVERWINYHNGGTN